MMDEEFKSYLRREVIALELMAAFLERIAIACETAAEVESREAAISAWAHGQGKHPDD